MHSIEPGKQKTRVRVPLAARVLVVAIHYWIEILDRGIPVSPETPTTVIKQL